MKTIHSFNVYSFFVLGLLIGAFSVFFFMAGNTATESDDGINFGTQSYEAEVELPESGYISDSKAFDAQCIGVECQASCQGLGKSSTECKNVCKDLSCEAYVAAIKSGGNTTTHDAGSTGTENALAPSFNVGKRTITETQRNDSINNKNTGDTVSNAGFIYKINNKHHNEFCEQLECISYCVNIKGIAKEDYCKENCVSTGCKDIQAKGNLANYEIQ